MLTLAPIVLACLAAPTPSPSPRAPTTEHFRYAVEFPHGEGGGGWVDVEVTAARHEVVVKADDRTWRFGAEVLDAMRERWGARTFAPRWGSELCSEGDLVWRYAYGKYERSWCRNQAAVNALAELSSLLQLLLR